MTFSLKRNRIDKLPKDVVLDELSRVAKHYDHKYFTGRQFDKVAIKCKRTTILNIFGTWEAALQAAGLNVSPTRKQRKDQISEGELFAEMERVWKLLGHRPSRNEWENSSPKFSYTTFKTRFCGWTEACARFIEYKSAELSKNEELTQNSPRLSDQLPAISIPSARRRGVPDRLRLRVLARDGFSCVLCGRSPAIERGVTLHIDHWKAFSKGGDTVLENLRTLCKECNLGKGSSEILCDAL